MKRTMSGEEDEDYVLLPSPTFHRWGELPREMQGEIVSWLDRVDEHMLACTCTAAKAQWRYVPWYTPSLDVCHVLACLGPVRWTRWLRYMGYDVKGHHAHHFMYQALAERHYPPDRTMCRHGMFNNYINGTTTGYVRTERWDLLATLFQMEIEESSTRPSGYETMGYILSVMDDAHWPTARRITAIEQHLRPMATNLWQTTIEYKTLDWCVKNTERPDMLWLPLVQAYPLTWGTWWATVGQDMWDCYWDFEGDSITMTWFRYLWHATPRQADWKFHWRLCMSEVLGMDMAEALLAQEGLVL